MVLCGHIHYDDLVMRIDTGIYGNAIPQLLVDAQDMDYYHEGVGMIALLTFNNNGRDVAVNWYSVKEGKLFRDWNQFTFSIEVGAHTIAFNSQGGSDVFEQIVEHGNLLTTPIVPMFSGYTFAGWYKEEYCITLWNFATDKVNNDVTLYAKWIQNIYDDDDDVLPEVGSDGDIAFVVDIPFNGLVVELVNVCIDDDLFSLDLVPVDDAGDEFLPYNEALYGDELVSEAVKVWCPEFISLLLFVLFFMFFHHSNNFAAKPN